MFCNITVNQSFRNGGKYSASEFRYAVLGLCVIIRNCRACVQNSDQEISKILYKERNQKQAQNTLQRKLLTTNFSETAMYVLS